MEGREGGIGWHNVLWEGIKRGVIIPSLWCVGEGAGSRDDRCRRGWVIRNQTLPLSALMVAILNLTSALTLVLINTRAANNKIPLIHDLIVDESID